MKSRKIYLKKENRVQVYSFQSDASGLVLWRASGIVQRFGCQVVQLTTLMSSHHASTPDMRSDASERAGVFFDNYYGSA